MSRYRKVQVRTWSDEKFRSLTPMAASGQGLWLFLMTGPHTGPIPGLFRAGRAGMAEELGWELEAFDKAFLEVSEKGMAKADFRARLVWLPSAIKHNRPESPNVVKSWRTELDLLPECGIKTEAAAFIRAYLQSLGPAFARAFDDNRHQRASCDTALTNASQKASGKALVNQEQEQEQEQERLPDRGSPDGEEVSIPLDGGSTYVVTKTDIAEWTAAHPHADVMAELRKAAAWNSANPTRRKTRGGIRRHLNSWIASATPTHKPAKQYSGFGNNDYLKDEAAWNSTTAN